MQLEHAPVAVHVLVNCVAAIPRVDDSVKIEVLVFVAVSGGGTQTVHGGCSCV